MANTERFQAVIEVNKQKAEASVKQLEREVKAATEEVIKLKKKDSGATKEQIAAAERNAPLEKQAQIKANVWYRQWEDDHPEEENDSKKRQRGILLDRARKSIGAKKLLKRNTFSEVPICRLIVFL